MIQHIVLLKWKPGTTDEQIAEAFGNSQDLVDEIEGVEQITHGRNLAEADHGFTHALIVNLSDDDGLSAYLTNPIRQRYVLESLNPIEEQRIELDVSADASHRRVRAPGLDWEWGASVGMGLPPDE